MTIKRILPFLLSFCISSSFAEQKVLNINDALKLAEENNLSIKIQKNSLDDLKNKNNFSWNSISPSLSAGGTYSQNFEYETQSLDLSGTVRLNFSTNLFSAIQGAKINYENGLISYDQAVQQIKLNVWKAFYRLIYKQEYLSLQKQNLETAKTNYQQNQEQFRNGKISELDVLTSRVNYEGKKPVVEAAETDLADSFAVFNQLLGIDIETELKLEGSMDEILEIKAAEISTSNSSAPDILKAQKAVESARNALLSQRFSAYGPSVSGTYSVGKSFDLKNSTDSLKNNLSVSVSIPLDGYLPWSSGAVSINTARKNLETAELKLKNTETDVALKTESYMRKIRQGLSQIDSLKANVELAQKTYSMTKTAYNYGKTDFLSLQNASDSVLKSEINLKNQAMTLLETYLDLEFLLGLELDSIFKK